MSGIISAQDGALFAFIERCLQGVELSELCSEIKKLGYRVDYDKHKTKSSAIVELFRQRSFKVELFAPLGAFALRALPEGATVTAAVISLGTTASIASAAVVVGKGPRASLLRKRSKSEDMTQSKDYAVKAREVLVAAPSASPVTEIPSFLPKKKSSSAAKYSLQPIEPIDIETSDSDSKSDRVLFKKVHFCPECDSPLPNLSPVRNPNRVRGEDNRGRGEDEGRSRDEREKAEREMLQQQMRDNVYKQMEMWGEALGKTANHASNHKPAVHIVTPMSGIPVNVSPSKSQSRPRAVKGPMEPLSPKQAVIVKVVPPPVFLIPSISLSRSSPSGYDSGSVSGSVRSSFTKEKKTSPTDLKVNRIDSVEKGIPLGIPMVVNRIDSGDKGIPLGIPMESDPPPPVRRVSLLASPVRHVRRMSNTVS